MFTVDVKQQYNNNNLYSFYSFTVIAYTMTMSSDLGLFSELTGLLNTYLSLCKAMDAVFVYFNRTDEKTKNFESTVKLMKKNFL